MKAKVKNFYIEAIPMTLFQYNKEIKHVKIQHGENK